MLHRMTPERPSGCGTRLRGYSARIQDVVVSNKYAKPCMDPGGTVPENLTTSRFPLSYIPLWVAGFLARNAARRCYFAPFGADGPGTGWVARASPLPRLTPDSEPRSAPRLPDQTPYHARTRAKPPKRPPCDPGGLPKRRETPAWSATPGGAWSPAGGQKSFGKYPSLPPAVGIASFPRRAEELLRRGARVR
jgi:hypothetical protein